MLWLLLDLLWAGSLAQDQEYKLQVQESVTVQKGQCVSIPCTVFYAQQGWNSSTQAYGYWFQEGADTIHSDPVATNNHNRQVVKKAQNRFHLVGNPQMTNCSLYIRDTRERDTRRYIFRVERGPQVKYTYQHYPLSVHVTDEEPAPDIHVHGTLESGHPSNITCTMSWDCSRQKQPTFSWTGITGNVQDLRISNASMLTLTPGPQDHGTNLTCQVTLQDARIREKTVQLNVSYELQNLTISMSLDQDRESEVLNGSSHHIREGQSVRLVCKANSNPPASIRWIRGSLDLSCREPGVLHLYQVELEDHGEYVCRAQQPKVASLEASLTLLVKNPPQLLGPSCSWEDEGLNCNCCSRAQPAPSLRWRLGEELLEGNSGNNSYMVTSSSSGLWANSSLRLSRELTSNLRLGCEAQNTHGERTVTVLWLPGRPTRWTGVIQGAIWGAGVTALLAVCLCLIIMRVYRKKWAKKAESQEGIAQSYLNELSSDHLPPVEATSTSENEHHYAALSFHNMKPHIPQAQEATTYSEIKIRK